MVSSPASVRNAPPGLDRIHHAPAWTNTLRLDHEVTCRKLNAPIVLAHGLFGFTRIALGPLTLASYFRGIPDVLRAGGNEVLVTQVHPIAGVARRAEMLGAQILSAFPDEPVHLIGHSMGGLDARALLAEPDWSGRILSLTTIATPHLGSAIADLARSRVGAVYRLFEALGVDHGGFLDVTRDAAKLFHEASLTPASVPCFSIAGDPAVEDVSWPLLRLHAILDELEGPNDGLVSVASSNAFGTALPPWPVDHLHQMNWLAPAHAEGPGSFVCDLYARLIADLARLGFGAPDDRGPGIGPAPAWIADGAVPGSNLGLDDVLIGRGA